MNFNFCAPALSRTGRSNPLGKLDACLGNIKVAEATREAVDELANKAGVCRSEWVRTLIETVAHGRNHVRDAEARRYNLMTENVIRNLS